MPLGLVSPVWDPNLVPELCFEHSEKCVVPFSLFSFLVSFPLACWKRSLQLSVPNRMFLCSYLIPTVAAHNTRAVWQAQGSACKASVSQLVPTMTFLPLEPSCQPGFGKPGHGSALFLPNSLLWRPTPASSSGFELSHGSPISHGPRALHKNLHICSRVEFVLRAGGQDQLCGVTTKSLHMACSMAGEKGVPKHAKHSYFRVCAPWNPSCVPGRFCSLPGRGAMVSSASLVSQEPQPPVCHNLFSC